MKMVSGTSLSGSTLWRPPFPFRERRFGDSAAEAASRDLVTETMVFLEELAQAKASSFFWISSDCNFIEAQLRNVDGDQVTRYESELGELDPLHARRMKSEKCIIASLRADETRGQSLTPAYGRFLESRELGDELALILWLRDHPFGYASLCRGLNDPPFSLADHNWHAVHKYIEASLSHHFRFRYARIEHSLTGRFQINPREVDVVELIVQGKSNADIAEILGISMATVKVHVGNILRKAGVDSRLSLACVVNDLSLTR
ncbi:MAG: LuxR C-terminal-related transcriptional regulator [Sphingomonadaceae bacterium]